MWKCLIHVLIYFCLMQICYTVPDNSAADPNFSAPITNISVPVGREAIITCVVQDLVPYKVAWLRIDTQTILTIQNHIITKNHRVSVTITENRIFQLRIRDVRESDRGWYMCQINTDPMKYQTGYMDVVVPPDILDVDTSHDMEVQEGDNVTLKCAAAGSPPPSIEWRREKGKPLLSIGSKEIFSVKESSLQLKHANRHHMGAYLCIAHNGIPPTVSKRVVLIVNFPPAIWIRNEVIYASIGQKITLECITESHPNSVNYWMHGQSMVQQGTTYEMVTLENVFKVIMKLVVRPMEPSDFGAYKCIARNTLGETEKIAYLHHKSKMTDSQSYQASQIGSAVKDWNNENGAATTTTNTKNTFESKKIILFSIIILLIRNSQFIHHRMNL